LGQLDSLHAQNFEIQVSKGSQLREVFEVLLLLVAGGNFLTAQIMSLLLCYGLNQEPLLRKYAFLSIT
jgi:hypothetical protein